MQGHDDGRLDIGAPSRESRQKPICGAALPTVSGAANANGAANRRERRVIVESEFMFLDLSEFSLATAILQ